MPDSKTARRQREGLVWDSHDSEQYERGNNILFILKEGHCVNDVGRGCVGFHLEVDGQPCRVDL